MRKRIIIVGISSLMLMAIIIVTVVGIVLANNKRYETEDTKTFKSALELIEANKYNSNQKGYSINFIQEFSYEQKIEEEESIIDFDISYESDGEFILSYETNDAKNVNLEKGFSSIIKNSNGFVSGVQNETHEINNKENNKQTNETVRQDSLKYSTSNYFVVDTNESNISVLSNTSYKNLSDSSKDVNDIFAGKISRSVLVDTIDDEGINKAVDKIMFIDVWDSVNTLLALMHKQLNNFDVNNYKALYDYIKDRNFSFSKDDNSINIKFEMSLDKTLNEEKNNYDNVFVEMKIDNKTGEIQKFKIDLSKYLTSILEEESKSSIYFKSNVRSYVIDGRIINSTIQRPETNVSYTEYTEDNKYDFIDRFINKALPVREDIY